MSTLSGRPLDPIDDLSAYASQKARERAAPQQHPSENDDPSLASPYAPKRARGIAGAHPVASSSNQPGEALDGARARPVVDLDAAASSDAHPLPRFLVSAEPLTQDAQARHAAGVDESHPGVDDAPGTVPDEPRASEGDRPHSLKTAAGAAGTPEHPVDLDTAPALQPADAVNAGPYGQAPAKPDDDSFSGRDLERLEASLRWLQREEVTARLPPAARLPPVPGIPSLDDRGLIARGNKPPRSLEPERMAPPPFKSRGDKLRLALCMVIASVVVAAVSFYVAAGAWTSQPQPAAGPRMASSEPIVTRQASPAVQPEHGPIAARDDDRDASAQEEKPPEPAETLPAEKSPGRDTVAMLQPAETAAQPPVRSKAAVRALDPEAIKLLLQQGEQLIAAGDLVTARLVFQRAAEAGDATAALALGATYDPGVLARLGVVGMGAADVEKARSWYEKAASFGSPDAARRLQLLANR